MAAAEEVQVPDIGDFHDVDVIEVLVKPGDRIEAEASLITLESEKATMEVPAPKAGTVKEVRIKVGDKVSQGSPILTLEPEAARPPQAERAAEPERPASKSEITDTPAAAAAAPWPTEPPAGVQAVERPPPLPLTEEATLVKAHASPSVRRLARELGADLGRIPGSGPKGRILKQDVQTYVRHALAGTPGAAGGAVALPPMPEVDFGRFGPVETRPLTKIQQVSGTHLHRNWVNIPHVTQFGEADVTDLEAFRKTEGERLQPQGVRLSLLAFFVKASVAALKRFPDFNSSLHPDGSRLVLKRYFHVGVAVDTPQGLVVPVLRDADRLGLVELSGKLTTLAEKARARKLGPEAMQGGCFTISSLGGIGGSFFTPIINAPEVAILGVSRAQFRPVYRDGALQERLILPLSLSFDHRVVDGAAAARFVVFLGELLSDPRRLLL